MKPLANPPKLPFVIAIWLIGIIAGYQSLLRYSLTPGENGFTPSVASSEVAEWRTTGRPLVIMALHPQCSCSEASVNELADVLGWTPDRFDLVLLTYAPAAASDSWKGAKSYPELARYNPRIVPDPGGGMAEQLGARTSGHVIVYNLEGQLAFSGGLTPGRGHRGRTRAQYALRELFRGAAPSVRSAPNYGCAIQDLDNLEN